MRVPTYYVQEHDQPVWSCFVFGDLVSLESAVAGLRRRHALRTFDQEIKEARNAAGDI